MPIHEHIICLDPIRLLQLVMYLFCHTLGLFPVPNKYCIISPLVTSV